MKPDLWIRLPDWSLLTEETAAAEAKAICAAVIARMGLTSKHAVAKKFGLPQSTFANYCRGRYTFARHRNNHGSYQHTRVILHRYLMTGEIGQAARSRSGYTRHPTYADEPSLITLVHKMYHEDKFNLSQIGRELEALGIKTMRGNTHWYGSSVRLLLNHTQPVEEKERPEVTYSNAPKPVEDPQQDIALLNAINNRLSQIDNLRTVVTEMEKRIDKRLGQLESLEVMLGEAKRWRVSMNKRLDDLERPAPPKPKRRRAPPKPTPPPAPPKPKRRLLDLVVDVFRR